MFITLMDDRESSLLHQRSHAILGRRSDRISRGGVKKSNFPIWQPHRSDPIPAERKNLTWEIYPCPYLPLGRARTGRAGHCASRDALRARCSASKVGIRERKIIGPEIRNFATASGVQVIIVARAYGIPPSGHPTTQGPQRVKRQGQGVGPRARMIVVQAAAAGREIFTTAWPALLYPRDRRFPAKSTAARSAWDVRSRIVPNICMYIHTRD